MEAILPDTFPEPPQIDSEPVTLGVRGEAYSYAAVASGAGPMTWTLVSAPAWLGVDAGTGVLSGTPDQCRDDANDRGPRRERGRAGPPAGVAARLSVGAQRSPWVLGVP